MEELSEYEERQKGRQAPRKRKAEDRLDVKYSTALLDT